MNFLFYSSSILTFLFSVLLAVRNNTGLAWLGLILGAAFSACSGFCVFAFFKDKTEKAVCAAKNARISSVFVNGLFCAFEGFYRRRFVCARCGFSPVLAFSCGL